MAVNQKIRDAFVACDAGEKGQTVLIKSLQKVYKKMPQDEFWADFVSHLKRSMIVFKREPAVERVIEFVAQFVASLQLEEKGEKEKDKDKPEDKKYEAGDSEEEQEEEDVETHPMVLHLLNFLLQYHNGNDKAVRFRCCQLVNKVLTSLGKDVAIDDELFDRIYDCMLMRLRDKIPAVRLQAVIALSRLQDPTDPDCPIIKAYLFLLRCDTSADVRRIVLSSITASTKTLAAILDRTRDVNDRVRRCAYQVLAEKIHVRALTIAQRVKLLHDGLNDRVEAVRSACVMRLLQSWLRTYGGNLRDLLKSWDVENCVETAELAMRELFKKTPPAELVQNFDLLNEDLVLPIEELGCESVVYWRGLSEYLRSLGPEYEELLDKLMPTPTNFAKWFAEVLQQLSAEEDVEMQLTNDFILHQLLVFSCSLDHTDTFGRNSLRDLVTNMLASDKVRYTLVEPFVGLYLCLETNEDTRIRHLMEVISDIREPITVIETTMTADQIRQRDLKIAGIRVELNQLREELDGAVHDQDFVKATALKERLRDLQANRTAIMDETQPSSQEIRTERNDFPTLLKCLSIACELLEGLKNRGLNAMLQTLIETQILPGIQSTEPAVRNLAVRALGLCGLLCADTARKHLLLFMQVAQVDQEGVRVTSLRVIFDFLHLYGLAAFNVDAVTVAEEEKKDGENEEKPNFDDDEEEEMDQSAELLGDEEETVTEPEQTTRSILSVLMNLLDRESVEVRSVCAEGLAKLLMAGRVVEHNLVSRLLLLWYNPVTEDEIHLRHCLGCFFPMYAFASRVNLEVMETAVLPTLRTLFEAPSTSPLTEVNTNNVAELLVHLTNQRHLLAQNNNITLQDVCPHDNLAVKLCNEILRDPTNFNIPTLCHVLNLLELSATNTTAVKDLSMLCQSLLEEVKDKQSRRTLESFQRSVTAMLKLHEGKGETPLADTTTAPEVSVTVAEVDDVTTAMESVSVAGTDNIEEDESQDPGGDSERVTAFVAESDVSISTQDSQQSGSTRSNRRRGRGRGRGGATSQSKVSQPKAMAKLKAVVDSQSSGENDVFESPAPTTRSTRSARSTRTKETVDKTRVNLSDKLSEPDTQSDHDSQDEPLPKRRATRRTCQQRTPLGDIDNGSH